LGDVVNEGDFERRVRGDFLKFLQGRGMIVDVVVEVFGGVGQVGGVEEKGGNRGVDEGGFETRYVGKVEVVEEIG
ncbi:hypothetical protein, partial [Neisseria sicca]|uniref:hypothetical protein n=1 Tax=Neisseria sicca TaxID=490 RepID=UPI001649C951